MKTNLLIIFLAIYSNAFPQDLVKMQSRIDSLKFVKTEYEKKIQQINLDIKEIENKMVISNFENFENLENLKYVIPLRPTVKIRAKNNPSAEILFEPPKGEIITLIDFDDETDYWVVSFNNKIGYVNEVLIQQSKSMDDYKKYLVAKKNQKSEEAKKIVAENAKKAAEQKKIEAQKLEENKILDAQKRAEEAERLAIEAKILQVQRKVDFTKKYGSTIADKILASKIWIGMTDEMAKESWGAPLKNNRSVGSWGVHEQWVYSDDVYLYFENGILTSWQDKRS